MSEFADMYAEATVVGATVLHRAGWAPQIPSRVNVAILDTRMPVVAKGYDVVGRPAEWFQPTKETGLGLRALTPVEAIIDAWRFGDQWRAPPDNLEDDTPWNALRAAFEAAGVPWPEPYATWEPEKYLDGRRIRR